MIATLTPDHKYLNLVVVNATEKDQKFDLSVTGAKTRRFRNVVEVDREQPRCR